MARNPVLSGFHPDPSMIFVDGVFYIANSTFEYYPGVRISKSTDLVNWHTVGYALTTQLSLRGAPDLSYDKGKFYLAFTDVKSTEMGPAKDTPNFIVTSDSIEGPWSEPVYINSSGFDPSLFHDEDGRKYFVNMEWDYRKKGISRFTGILFTELDEETLLPVREPVSIFSGTELGFTEGPHIYKKDGWYYLITAEGGTSYGHAVTVAQSKSLYGPYVTADTPYLLSARNAPESPLQKCGHGSLCEDDNGRWWIAYLCGRPLSGTNRCIMGRETAISELIWSGGWPCLKSGEVVPKQDFDGYAEQSPLPSIDLDFKSGVLAKEFQSLRVPASFDILENGTLRLYGKEFINSRNFQNMLVTRQRSFDFQVETAVVNANRSFMCFGGLVYRYSEANQYYLQLAFDENMNANTVKILQMNDNEFSIPDIGEIIIDADTVHFRIDVQGEKGYFFYSADGKAYRRIEYLLDVSILSDEYQRPGGFTGSMVGIAATDMQYMKAPIDFLYFRYRDIPPL